MAQPHRRPHTHTHLTQESVQSLLCRAPRLVEHARLVGRDHVLDVDEGVLAAVDLEELERLRDEVAQRLTLLLRIVDAVAQVEVPVLEDVEHGQDLAVVGHERLADHVARDDHLLQDLEDGADDLGIPCVERRLDRDDQLRDHGQDLGAAVLQHVAHALHREEAVGLLLLPQAVEEDGQVVVVVELLNIHLPSDAVVHPPVLDLDGEVAALVESPELGVGGVGALLEGAARRRARRHLVLLAHGK
mmetsp:Transcript_72987/g.176111  ORF Transcript_72987/g.176111 Transcript_72987/m.176111 type:complete len:245 (-) Transcript_72987:370-1104(-)